MRLFCVTLKTLIVSDIYIFYDVAHQNIYFFRDSVTQTLTRKNGRMKEEEEEEDF
jgi:hypothetical protein